MTKYEIKQEIGTVYKRWLHTLETYPNYRVALSDYKKIIAENPDKYFELIEIKHDEFCLDFTPKKD